MKWAVFNDDNVQRDDLACRGTDYTDADAAIAALKVALSGDEAEARRRGATDCKHLAGCAIATLVACAGFGQKLMSPAVHNGVWAALDELDAISDETR